MIRLITLTLSLFLATALTAAAQEPSLPNTAPLTATGDLSVQMVAGIDTYLDQATAASISKRAPYWMRNLSSPAAYSKSVAPNRARLRTITGAVDELADPVLLSHISGPGRPALIAESGDVRIFAVRWNVSDGIDAEGLLLEPIEKIRASVVAIPDAGQTPEAIAGLAGDANFFALRLAAAGCRVLVPTLLDRRNNWSGNPEMWMTDQPHREWIWRHAVEFGRHPIGYEIRKIESAVSWLASHGPEPVGVAGYGEGGLIALYTAALDKRIDATLVSGYFQSRQQIWSEPIYRTLFGLLREFGDAEIATLVAPGPLVIEHSPSPTVTGPPEADASRRKGAAPGRIEPPQYSSIQGEVQRARRLLTPPSGKEAISPIDLVADGDNAYPAPGSTPALEKFLAHLGLETSLEEPAKLDVARTIDADARQHRQVDQLVEHTQRLLRRSPATRDAFWKPAVPESHETWDRATRSYKDHLWTEVLGRMPPPNVAINPRSRLLEEHETWTTHEVMLDVWPGIFAWGYLLVPKDIAPGERRPVVVCQHGLEGLPASVIDEDETSRAWRAYRAYANRLAERGFVVYAPHNPYRGKEAFRQLQRKGWPLKLTLYSFILGQHQRTLHWLSTLPFTDSSRVGFYGLSYGGTTAVRVPPLLDGYALTICSAAFNDWARKVVSLDFPAAYIYTGEHDHFYFNQANTFNNAELAALMAPRPFMVERGHDDGVAPDEWVASEFAKIRRLYTRLGIAGRAEIEWFEGRHEIHGVSTFDFLHRHLAWPKR